MKKKNVFCEFAALVSGYSVKSKKLLDKFKEIFSERKVDKAKTQFLWFNGTNSMSGSKAGLQRF